MHAILKFLFGPRRNPGLEYLDHMLAREHANRISKLNKKVEEMGPKHLFHPSNRIQRQKES